jgi:hypothetical protein
MEHEWLGLQSYPVPVRQSPHAPLWFKKGERFSTPFGYVRLILCERDKYQDGKNKEREKIDVSTGQTPLCSAMDDPRR